MCEGEWPALAPSRLLATLRIRCTFCEHSLFVIASPTGRGNPVRIVVSAAHVSAGLPRRDIVPPRNDKVAGRTATPVSPGFRAALLRQFHDCPAGGADGDELVFAVGE
jgi:hypothetical protein